MGLLVYKFSDYKHTAEREQFRVLCKSLKDYYGNRNEACIFIANFNVHGVELDAFIIKNDAFICIEFKNYGGQIIAADNGEWMLSDGTIIKGGSGKTVYQQASLNRLLTKKGVKRATGLTNSQVNNLSSLIVFNQAISGLDTSRLSHYTKCWLHIADNSTFVEKVQDIVDERLNFEHSDLLKIMNSLYLDKQYLVEEYSNAEMLSPDYRPTAIKLDFHQDGMLKMENVGNASTIEKELKEDKADNDSVVNGNEDNIDAPSKSTIDDETQAEIEKLSAFIHQVFKQICQGVKYNLYVYHYDDPNLIAALPNFSPKRQWFLIVQIPNALEIVEKVRKFMHRDVAATDGYLTFEVGLPITDEDVNTADEQANIEKEDGTPAIAVIDKLKSHTTLPSWLDRLLFDKIGALYNPNYQRHSYNLDLSEEEVLNYLGTYFPRSYAEAFCIYDNICSSAKYIDALKNKSEVNILDVGCGTGGELVGLISVFEKHLPTNIKFRIEAFDGNEYSLEKLQEILAYITKKSQRIYEVTTTQKVIKCTDDIEMIVGTYVDRKFDIIQMCKFGCELESHKICKMANPYQLLLTQFGKLLSDEGLFLLLDVTTLSHTDKMYYPQLLNMGVRDSLRKQPTLSVLLPMSCHKHNEDCLSPCFTQKEFSIRHSKKIGDVSRVAYRVVAHKSFINTLEIDETNYKFLVKGSGSVDLKDCICQYSQSDGQIIDAYKFRIK